uniref:Protein eyes shut n=1 Tax=Cacopsylla melanoneura TaxID=428564 RepID=A0A8D8VZW2_9HEMI
MLINKMYPKIKIKYLELLSSCFRFVGTACELSVCDDNPCMFGATCVQYPGSGFLCLCPLGKHGIFCEHDIDIGQASYSSSVAGLSSFSAYLIPATIHHSFELKFRFVPNTMDQIALLAFIGQDYQHDAITDHLAVSFIKGYVVLTWNLGSGMYQSTLISAYLLGCYNINTY